MTARVLILVLLCAAGSARAQDAAEEPAFDTDVRDLCEWLAVMGDHKINWVIDHILKKSDVIGKSRKTTVKRLKRLAITVKREVKSLGKAARRYESPVIRSYLAKFGAGIEKLVPMCATWKAMVGSDADDGWYWEITYSMSMAFYEALTVEFESEAHSLLESARRVRKVLTERKRTPEEGDAELRLIADWVRLEMRLLIDVTSSVNEAVHKIEKLAGPGNILMPMPTPPPPIPGSGGPTYRPPPEPSAKYYRKLRDALRSAKLRSETAQRELDTLLDDFDGELFDAAGKSVATTLSDVRRETAQTGAIIKNAGDDPKRMRRQKSQLSAAIFRISWLFFDLWKQRKAPIKTAKRLLKAMAKKRK